MKRGSNLFVKRNKNKKNKITLDEKRDRQTGKQAVQIGELRWWWLDRFWSA